MAAMLPAAFLWIVLGTGDVSAASKATQAKIHFINLDANNDAILLECNGLFGMVDSGEDSSYPTGSDKRYPWRPGIVKGNGQAKKVVSYLKKVGVKRLEFYIGTHPHSDHIGNAGTIIKTFCPKRVYLRPYKDSYITNKDHLWDNLYVYDNVLKAIQEVNQAAEPGDGTALVQYFEENAAPVSRSNSSLPQTGRPTFVLGDGMSIEIMNYDAKLSAPDANYFSLGVKVTANGSTAFLSGDINNYQGTEDALAQKLGHVDVLKLGHHGYEGSNTVGYLKKLSPSLSILTGTVAQTRKEMWDTLSAMNTRTYVTALYAGSTGAIIINMDSKVSANIGKDKNLAKKIVSGYSADMHAYLYLKNGKKVVGGGFQNVGSVGYYFPAGSDTPLTNQWKKIKGKWYYFGNSGQMRTGWFRINGKWYYCNKRGVMQTGWLQWKGKKYYLDNTGQMVTGNQKIGKYWYHFLTNGAMFTGWLDNRHYYDEQGHWIRGRSKTGWQKSAAGYKWRYKNGTYAKNTWKTINGSKYYFNAKGYRATGLTKIKGESYYFTSSGKLYTGWMTISGKKYYFTSKGMYRGFHTIGQKKYYFRAKGTLYQKQGLKSISGKKYCFQANGAIVTGWKTISGKKYYFNADGTAAAGWKTIDGKRYYFNANGTAAAGWKTIDGKKYYFSSEYTALEGFQAINGSFYLFDSSGALQKAPAPGWHSWNGTDYYYYLTKTTLHVGWLSLQTVDTEGLTQTQHYYLDPHTGVMATGLIELPDWKNPEAEETYFYYFMPTVNPGQAGAPLDWGMMTAGQELAITLDDGTSVTYRFDEDGKGIPVVIDLQEPEISWNSISENSISENSILENSISENSISENSISGEPVFGYFVPGDPVSGYSVPKTPFQGILFPETPFPEILPACLGAF